MPNDDTSLIKEKENFATPPEALGGFSQRQNVGPSVCLITPGHISNNPQLAKEAETLSSAGYDVTVLACDYSPWGRVVDQGFRAKSWSIVKPVHFGPLAPVAVRIKQGVRVRVARKMQKFGLRGERLALAASHPAGPELARAASRIRADLYIAHYPPALAAAAMAARRNAGVYAFDAEDFHLGDPPDRPEFDAQRRMTRAIEQKYLPGATYITASSPEIAKVYAESYGIDTPTVLLNVFPRADTPKAPTDRGCAGAEPSLYWFSQTIGPNRGLECALQAIARATSWPNLYLRGQFAAGYEADLDALARSVGCRDRLHFLDPAPPGEMVRLAAQYDLGLASEIGHTPNNERALSNKLFTYLLAGLPTIVSDTPAQAQFAVGKETCLRVYRRGDSAALAAALDYFLLDKDQLAQARHAAFELGRARYNWDVEQRTLLDTVERALSKAHVVA